MAAAYLALAFFLISGEIHLAQEGKLPRAPEHSGLRGHIGRQKGEGSVHFIYGWYLEMYENARSIARCGIRSWMGREASYTPPCMGGGATLQSLPSSIEVLPLAVKANAD